jgi:membrane associated rhomboid family serine protease
MRYLVLMNFLSFLRKPFHYEFWNAALILIGANLAVFLLTAMYPELSRYLSLNPLFMTQGGMYWQPFTYQFVHSGFSHLLSNMLGLAFFGLAVERRIGSKEFLLLYLLSGTLCGILSFLIYIATGAWYVFLMGASGAVFAILLAYAVLYPDSVIFIWGIVPIPAPLLVIGYAGIEVFDMLTGTNSGIAHGTHLIGFAVAWAYFLVRFSVNPMKVWSRRK